MVAERVRTQIRSLAGAGLDLESFSQSAFDLLGRVVPFEAACLGAFDPATHLVTRTEKAAIDHSHDRAWAHFEYEYDDVAQFLSLAQRPNVATTIAAETGGDALASVRLREFLQPVYSFGHELRTAVGVDGSVWGGVALHRGVDSPGFTDLEVEFVSTVGSAIAHGLRASVLVTAISTAAADVHGPAVLIVDDADEIVQVSTGAEQRFAELTGEPFEPWNQLPLSMLSLVAAARAHAAGRLTTMPRLRVRSPRGDWWVAHATVLASRDGGARDVVVTIEEARPPEIVPIVVAAFGLTARERDVVRMVLQGIDTGEIARALHLSAYTVQDHLKSIFAKAGVRSRRELMSRVFFDQYADRLGSDVAPNGWFTPAGDA
jgi:DNA-binding CsgD family transcriptional regulator